MTHSIPRHGSGDVRLFTSFAALATIAVLSFPTSTAVLVTPSIPPRGWNSFDLQFDRRYNSSVPVWNETVFRSTAQAMARQLLPHGYDTIVIDGGWVSFGFRFLWWWWWYRWRGAFVWVHSQLLACCEVAHGAPSSAALVDDANTAAAAATTNNNNNNNNNNDDNNNNTMYVCVKNTHTHYLWQVVQQC